MLLDRLSTVAMLLDGGEVLLSIPGSVPWLLGIFVSLQTAHGAAQP